ncbi:hypothetical protein uav_057 [Pseudomonas phage UAVern]|uniref:Uncharacterized protein n=1 Tax=Pseudomonas phage UAVern TaxID=2856997 RepID=A0A975UUR1_9CAUD|nr:hypothetical protein uav_057 [Pseudomonas phage UAVern]
MTEGELFERFVSLELAAMAHKEDVKALREEAKEVGHEAKRIGMIKAAAKLHVENTFEEKEEATMELFELYKELTGYDTPNPQNAAQTAEFLKDNPEF